ncbi:MAG: 6-phosphogluconolactonase [Candidatus Rokubacteria bacterium]|nr:6-phosphogluconolactonase [Candidatus Rokubacteria bacterium]
MNLVIADDAAGLARAAADLFRARVKAKPDLAMAMPAGRTPRPMYALMRQWQSETPVSFAELRVFSVDELCPPAPPDGYFWRQVRHEFLAWANATPARLNPFRVDATDLAAMCAEYEAAIGAAGGLGLVMLGLGPNGHIASNEPGTPFDTRTRPVRLLPETVGYILTDDVIQGAVCDTAVTLGVATIMDAREVVVLVSGAGKRTSLRRVLDGPVMPAVPASVLRDHPNVTILADRAAVD